MGLFSWLGSLLDQLLDLFEGLFVAFFEALIWGLQAIWEIAVAAVLIAAFGLVATLYVIFYAGYVLGETIMEVWDPSYVNSKPSQVFSVEQAPQSSPLPKTRSEAKKLKLRNWH
jgi:hypothetical protein